MKTISAARLAANRANAQKSTGPTSAEGKAISSKNRLGYGFNSAMPCMNDEDPAEFERLRVELHNEHRPVTPTETILVDKMVLSHWHYLRATRVINNLICDDRQPQALVLAMRYQTSNHNAFHKALTELQKLKAQRPQEVATANGFVPQNRPEAVPSDPCPPAPSAKTGAANVPQPASRSNRAKSIDALVKKYLGDIAIPA